MIERSRPLKKEVVAREIERLKAEIASTKRVHEAALEVLRSREESELEQESTIRVYRASMEALKERLEFFEGMHSRMR
jgi:outer membrane PBP1 activator LpoA protein